MSKKEALEAIKKLLNCLENERVSLRDGRFLNLEATVATKEGLLDKLKDLDVRDVEEELDELRKRMDENQSLMAAAQKGFEHANERLTEIRNAIGQLKTYDGSGNVKSNPTIGPSVSLKA